jgi:dolichol kinase
MIFNDLFNALWLALYNAFIILYLSRKVYERFGKYVARKTIHLLSAGVSLILCPFLFSDLSFPVLLAGLMIFFTVLGHAKNFLDWFQERENYADVYFTGACALLLAMFWNYNLWIGILSCLFMAWGDGVTGLIRYVVYKRRTKGIWGNIVMLTLCASLGYFLLGYVGLAGGAFSSLVEKFEKVDDNISVPLSSAVIMTALGFLK